MQKVTLLLLMFFAGIASVSAAPVRYTLNNVFFDDGSTASGTFTFDVVCGPCGTGGFTNINIATTDGSLLGDMLGDTYTSARDAGNSGLFGADYGINSDTSTIRNIFSFDFNRPLNDFSKGNTFVLGLGTNEYSVATKQAQRYVVSGSVVAAVPIPAAVWLFGSGLGLLGWIRRKPTV